MRTKKYSLVAKTSVATLTLSLLVAAVILLVITPYKITNDYSYRVSAGAQTLREDFTELEQTLALSIFSTPDSNPADNLADVEIIEEKIKKVTAKLESFQDEASKYTKAQYTSPSFIYNKADTTAQDVNFMASQSMEVIEEYAKLAAFMKSASQTMATLERHMDYVNAVRDFDVFSGSQGTLRERANAVRMARSKLAKEPVTGGYASVKDTLLERSMQLADALDDLADGLQAAVDDRIYGAVKSVEEIAKLHYGRDRSQLFKASQDSPTLAGVSELADKLIILEVLER
jgi:hypothetical protein